ncbi:uncharacterized protein [Tenebrio molitor]|uniref:uncharacterized protein n=1 Tax=Tenebrio molitor TaxID=7067 RepID=UPI0036247148
MDLLKGPEKNLKQIAGAIGVIQSLAWIIMALICIILYYTEPTDFSPYGYHYMDEVGEIIYQLYLKRYNQELYFDGQILTPGVFIGFSWVYLIIDLTWFATSWLVLLQKRGNLRRIFQIWSANTALVCLLDLIIIIILSSNYQKCLSEMGISLEIICANGILPVLVIAGKGFVLWIVNAIFVVVVWKISKQLQQETPLNHFMPRANLQGSSNVGVPLQQVDAAYFQPYEHKPLSSAIPSAPFSTVPRSPVRQSWSIYAVQEPAQQPYRQYQQQPFAPPRRY